MDETLPLEESLRRRFDVVASATQIAGRPLELLHPRTCDDLISEQDFDIDGRLPYWAQLWPSSQVLAERIAGLHGEGGRCLELGCGLGLLSIAAALAGFRPLATDYYAEALEFAEQNARRCGVEVQTRLIDWRTLPADLEQFDLVLAADVLYERPLAPLVAAALAQTLSPRGLALVADPGRIVAAGFPEECTRHGLRVVAETRTQWLANPPVTVTVWEIQRSIGV